jgi:hypothetical protein
MTGGLPNVMHEKRSGGSEFCVSFVEDLLWYYTCEHPLPRARTL